MPLWLIIFAPVLAALICGFMALTDRKQGIAPIFGLACTALSALAALSPSTSSQSIFADGAAPGIPHVDVEWLALGNFRIAFGVHLDHLALIMVCVVCAVSFLVQLYSIGYMKGEAGYARYFAYLSLFTASMLGLVVADNLFQLYVSWELVGICSYLLIGFWWQKPSAANAAKKAFVVTRFGDVGFMLGVLLLSTTAGSFRFTDAMAAVQRVAGGDSAGVVLFSGQTFLWLVPVLLFCGAIGKSAQFPLHVWLPDAMEGPTPVSALIHAATMVAAGVYMVARLFPIFEGSQIAMTVVLGIGAITALIAATIAMVQFDIKKVMAYSTVSQLGYMMMGLGAGSRMAGMFHLTTHAAFKALLFLTAGSVIHALHHAEDPNDLRGMGGLQGRMRVTSLTCLVGVGALAGFPLLSGFWSKDSILDALLNSTNPLGKVGLAVALAVAGLTAFYATRMWMLAFAGQPRSDHAAHAKESSLWMTIPLIVLAVPSLALGYLGHHHYRFGEFLLGNVPEAYDPTNWGMAITASIIAAAGIAAAVMVYRPQPAADPILRMPGYRFFANLWGLDAFWNQIGARTTLAVGRFVALFDRNVIDRYVANGPGWLCARAGQYLRRTATGQAQSYTAVMLAAAAVLAGMLILYESQVGGSLKNTEPFRPRQAPSRRARIGSAGLTDGSFNISGLSDKFSSFEAQRRILTTAAPEVIYP